MHPPVSIAAATPEDSAAISAFAREIWHMTYKMPPHPAGLIDYMLDRFQSPGAISQDMTERGRRYYIAKLDGELIGYTAGYVDGADLVLSKLYVNPARQGAGLGRTLLNRAIAEMGGGCSRVRLTCDRLNAVALAFYARMGFVNQGQVEIDVGNGYICKDYLLAMPLTGAVAALDIKAVIFDMDGLLFDTEQLYLQAWAPVGEAMGLPNAVEIARLTIGIGYEDSETIFQSHYGPAFRMEQALPIMSQWIERYITEHGMPCMPFARELVQLLHGKGFPLAIGSSNLRSVAEAFLDAAGLLQYFTAIVTGDMVEYAKPAPDIFLRAARELGFPPEQCLVLDDSPIGILAAYRAGCIPAMVPDLLPPTDETYGQLWRKFSSLEQIPLALF